MAKQMQFLGACRDYFGMLPGQDGKGFYNEMKALTPADRQEIKAGLEQNGYEIVAAEVKAA